MTAPAQSPIRLQPELDELYRLVEYIEIFAEENSLRPADAHALTLAAEELFANTVKHSHPPAGFAEFSVARHGDAATATYEDDASPFDPTGVAEPDTALPVELRSIGGLGIHFIRQTMQDFVYARQDGRNVITFTRRLT